MCTRLPNPGRRICFIKSSVVTLARICAEASDECWFTRKLWPSTFGSFFFAFPLLPACAYLAKCEVLSLHCLWTTLQPHLTPLRVPRKPGRQSPVFEFSSPRDFGPLALLWVSYAPEDFASYMFSSVCQAAQVRREDAPWRTCAIWWLLGDIIL